MSKHSKTVIVGEDVDIDAKIEEAAALVDALCTPDKMTKEQAVEFLEGVRERLESSIEALDEDLDNDAASEE